MGERNLIPEIGKLYTADDYNQIGEEFTVGKKKYVFVKVLANTFIRQNSALYWDDNYIVAQAGDVRNPVFGAAAFDLDTTNANPANATANVNGYALVLCDGEMGFDAINKATSSVYAHTQLVPWDNGVMRSVNATVQIGAGLIKFLPLPQVVQLCATGDQNYNQHVAKGDIVYTNLGHYAAVGSVVNGSSLILCLSGTGYANDVSYLATMTYAGGTALGDDRAVCTSATYKTRQINASNLPAGWSVNVCTASTLWQVNTNIVGSFFKVGDQINIGGDTAASNRTITAIQNATWFTVNAAATAETYGLIGTKFNLNTFYVTARVGD